MQRGLGEKAAPSVALKPTGAPIVPFVPGTMPPPADVRAEQALISAVMVNPDAFPLIAEELTESDFFDPKHCYLWQAFQSLFEAGSAIEPVTVASYFSTRKMSDEVGGVEYISQLTSMSAPIDSLEHYAKIVREKALLRNMIRVSMDIAREAYMSGFDASEFLDRAESKILGAFDKREIKKSQPIGDVVKESVDIITERRDTGTSTVGILTGYQALDDILVGLRPSDVYLIGGRPGMGKTAFALNLMMNVAKSGHRVFFASIEMSSLQLADRLIMLDTEIDSKRYQTARYLSRSDLAKIEESRDFIGSLPIIVDDKSAMSLLDLRAKIKRSASRHGPIDLVIVDYLQLMAPPDKRVTNEQQQISQISAGLKALAKDLDIPIIALSQLSRSTENRPAGDNRPKLSDLRSSGSLEQDATGVLFLYRPEYYQKNKGERSIDDNPDHQLLEVIVAKHRHGATGIAKLRFIGESMTIEPWEDKPTVGIADKLAESDWYQGSRRDGCDF